MTKILTILILGTISFGLRGQNADSLSTDESTYLNDSFLKQRDDFNFDKKKIGFFKGSSSHKLWNKEDYFKSVKECLKNNTTMQHQLLILNSEEKINSGGYDAVVVACSKILVTDRDKTKLISKINGTKK